MSHYLTDVDGNKYRFETDQEVLEFLNHELTFWKNQLSIVSPQATPKHGTPTSQAGYIAIMIEVIDTVRDSYITGYVDFEGRPEGLEDMWIYSESDFTTRWLEIRNQNAIVAQGFFESIRFNDSSNISNFDFMRGYLLAYEFKQEEMGSFTARAEKNYERMSVFLKEAQTQLNKSISTIENQINENNTMHSEQETAWETAIERLKETYTADLRLKAPATYWEEKARRNAKQGQIAGGLLISFLIGVAYVLYLTLDKWLTGISMKLDLTSLGGVFIFIAFLSTLVFVTRTLSKFTFSAFHLQRDAEERQQLTHVYLALLKETSMDRETQNIIIQSLFSRTETGLLQNESGPTIPGIVELISAVKKN